MARTNFEESVLGDPNYGDLLVKVGCQYKTKGLLITAWQLAQKHWLQYKGVPKNKWPAALDVLLEFKFATIETRDSEEFVYVTGSKEHCAFLETKVEAGRKGGLSRSPSKTKTLKQNRSRTEAEPKHNRSTTEAKASETEASYSISNSLINSPTENYEIAALLEQPPLPVLTEAKGVVGMWCAAYKRRYGFNYDVSKQEAGQLTNFGKGRSTDRIQLLFACYFAISDKYYQKEKHPVWLFFKDRAKINAAAQTGKDPSRPDFEDLFSLTQESA